MDIGSWERIAQKRIELRASGGIRRTIEWDECDPELLFADLAQDSAHNASAIIDIGCGEGRLSRSLAQNGRLVMGVDISRVALCEAAAGDPGRKVCYVRADNRRLPFAEGTFDLALCRRGPGCDNVQSLLEVRRILRPGGQLVALITGECHRIETQEVFGRGLYWPPVKPARFAVPERLKEAGLNMIYFTECYATSFYPDIDEFSRQLETIPVIPDFDRRLDAPLLREVSRKLSTDRGIRDTEHMAVFVAVKPGQ